MKRKENKEWIEKSTVRHEEVGNIEEMVFVVFDIFQKSSKNVRKPMATNY